MKVNSFNSWILLTAAFAACASPKPENGYTGVAYTNPENGIVQQSVPGTLQCEYYDAGGEGIAFHDSDTVNSGSGQLNTGSDFLSTFRKSEAVDISFTKFHDQIDNSIFNRVQPMENQLYVGWTQPGEWTKYTIGVSTSGIYQVGLMYTANGNGQISISVNDRDKTGPLHIPTTFNEADTVDWRQWHHWNYVENLAALELQEGLQTLTLHTVTGGNMNYDFLSFTLKTTDAK